MIKRLCLKQLNFNCCLLLLFLILPINAYAEMQGFRAAILHYLGDPALSSTATQYFEDGLLIVEDGRVKAVGNYQEVKSQFPQVQVKAFKNALITPGYIDSHVHYPQVEMIGAFGEQLIEWLNTYTFPTEIAYANKTKAREGATFFLKELLRNGITTALVFTTVHKDSAEVFFEEAQKLNMRMIAGKVLMDRNAPKELMDTAESGYRESKELIQKWHGKDRLGYAITPRFALTSSDEQLRLAGKLKKEYPDVHVHTHVSENLKEIALVKSLFPDRSGYLDVYDHYGLVGPKTVLAHGVHLTDDELKRIGESAAAVAFCPTSNLFLGSGLFPMDKAEKLGVRIGFGSDVGAGTSLSNFRTQNEAYKIMQLQGKQLSAHKAFYISTLGSAKALYLDDKIGNFEVGKEADFVVLDLKATPLIDYRLSFAKNIDEKLFALMMIGDDRLVKSTYIMGKSPYAKGTEN